MRLGKYELLCELASGGMGTVHVARQLGAAGFSRLVVVKRLHPHLAKLPELRNMVRDEADLASQIRHPNVVPVVDVIEHGNELCLVLEYVPSVSLAALNRAAQEKGQVLDPAIASRIVLDVLAGLHAAHEVRDMAGVPLAIVHRDVSPQNVIVGADGSARLIDFGIAKAAVRFARTKTGDLKGKLSYMSPEQLQRKDVDRRADVYATGLVLFEALTGAPLYTGEDEGAIVLSILMGESADLVPKGFSRAASDVVGKALAAAPDDRFATARAFQEALEAVMPPASTNDVADVVNRLCGPSLEQGRERVRSFAGTDGGRGAAPEGVEANGEEPPRSPGSRFRRGRAVVPALAALAAVGVISALVVRRASSATNGIGERPPAASSEIRPVTTPEAPASGEAAASLAMPPLPSVSPSVSVSARAAPLPTAPSTTRAPRPSHGTAPPLRKNPYR
jgi:serine/threonine-protein kinase